MSRKRKTVYYISIYEKGAFYHPEEGGYYAEGKTLIYSEKHKCYKSAKRYLRKIAKEFDAEKLWDARYETKTRYKGDGYILRIETNQGSEEETDSIYM